MYRKIVFANLACLAVVLIGAGFLAARAPVFGQSVGAYLEDFTADRDPAIIFGGHLLLGTEDGWSGRLAEGRYTLENRHDPGAIRYFYLIPDEVDILSEGSRASVDISGDFPGLQGHSGAGLIYGFDPQTYHYLAFVIMERGSYGILQRDEEGVRIRMSGAHSAVREGRVNRLEISRSGQMLHFSVNGREVVSMGSQVAKGAGVGLLALGVGRFDFDNFRLDGTQLPRYEPAADSVLTENGLRTPEATAQPPRGFRRIEHDSGSGQLWLCDNMDGNSSRRALLEASDRLSDAFGQRPVLHAIIGDAGDQEARALFSARFGDRELRGLIVAARKEHGVVSACLFDTPKRLQVTFQPMIETIARHLPAAPPPDSPQPLAVNWQRVFLPDGSGSMMLPSDWRIAAASKGMVDAVGADGSLVSLGIHGPVLTPEMGAAYNQMPGATVRIPVAPYTDPITALQNLFPQLVFQVPQRLLSLIESAPTPWPHGGQAAFVHFEWQQGQGAQAKNFTSLALFGVMPGYGQWTFYLSIVSAPSPLFAQNLPMLMEIWKNWRVADHVHQERLNSAAADMREINSIIQQTHARRQQAQDRTFANWTEVFRDQTFLGDTQLGERYEVPLTQVEDWTRELNRAEGYERFRHIPLRELQ
jgi:hypothetical protein